MSRPHDLRVGDDVTRDPDAESSRWATVTAVAGESVIVEWLSDGEVEIVDGDDLHRCVREDGS